MKQWKRWLIVFCIGLALGLLIDHVKEMRARAAYHDAFEEGLRQRQQLIDDAVAKRRAEEAK